MSRTLFFMLVFFIIALPPVTVKIIWLLNAQKTTGVYYLEGRGNALDQIRMTESYIYFKHEKDTVFFKDLGNLPLKEGENVSVVYQENNPSDAKVDIFMCVWGTTVFYTAVPILALLITALHRGIIPYHAKVRVTVKRPYIRLI